jgi:Leucine-rich repeat (LRR) protein
MNNKPKKPFNKNKQAPKKAGGPPGIYKSLGKALENSTGATNLTITGSEALPLSEIARLKNLKTLIIRLTNVAELPPEIKELTSLENLDISDSSIESLPPETGRLLNLRTLNCEGSLLGELPPEVGNLKKLEVVSFRETPLAELPKEFFSLTGLKYLDLYETNLPVIPAEIIHFTNLEYLNVGTIDALPENYPEILAHFKKLKQFVAGVEGLGKAELEKLKKILPQNCKIV